MSRATGTVKWFSREKGYGFIRQADGPDVFVHYSAIQAKGFRTLEEGERVEFEIVEEPKGLRAQNVVRLDEPAEGAAPPPATPSAAPVDDEPPAEAVDEEPEPDDGTGLDADATLEPDDATLEPDDATLEADDAALEADDAALEPEAELAAEVENEADSLDASEELEADPRADL